jgi:precorrin-6Y C5,15-methyltransferase (decarboxylating)
VTPAAPLTVIGVDGRPLDPVAAARLASASLVVGAERHLAAVPLPATARTIPLGDVVAALDAIGAAGGPVVVLASGDPGFFGIVRLLRARGHRPQVLPGTSAVAVAFARAGLPWDDALVVSAHGRALRPAVNACRAHRKVAVLTGPGAGPAELGAALAGLPRRLVIAERLGMTDERVTTCTPAEAAAAAWSDPNVTLVLADPDLDPDPASPERPGWVVPRRQVPGSWALPDGAFEHRDGMVTKAEVRAVALARLAPGVGDLVWDVGAGSGSVAVECARFGAAAIAIDRDTGQCARVRRNATVHGVAVEVVDGTAPGCLAALPDPDAVYVGGGGPDVVAACAARGPGRLVVALAAVDRVGPVRDLLRSAGFEVAGAAVHASRLVDLPDGGSRLTAINPVFLLDGHR